MVDQAFYSHNLKIIVFSRGFQRENFLGAIFFWHDFSFNCFKWENCHPCCIDGVVIDFVVYTEVGSNFEVSLRQK